MPADELTVPGGDGRDMRWGSDAVAEALASLNLRFLALNPGASYRGLHDSLVNHLGNAEPVMLLCLHEEHAVAVAHGYAKVAERPMAVALHSNVGLLHGSMAIFNAWCDRVPMLILGATGPLDAAERRPWIDWIHTAGDQGALVRSFVKWDDQPLSASAAAESIVRAAQITHTHPCAPTYVNLDAGMQEAPLDAPIRLRDPARHQPPPPPAAPPGAVEEAVALLHRAERPLVLAGRVSRDVEAWNARVALVERLGAAVLTDLKCGASFPSAHPANPAPPGTFLTPGAAELVRRSDVILALDWIDLAGTLRQALGEADVEARVISATMDASLHNGWSKDHFALAPVDVAVATHPDVLSAALLASLPGGPPPARRDWPPRDLQAPAALRTEGAEILIGDLAAALSAALTGRDATLVRVPLGWQGRDLQLDHPLDYLGQDGGGGIGSGPGMVVGAALALQESGRLAVGVIGDGDFMMGNTALWTAAHYGLPLLLVVANNRSFFNDEVHQERVALERGRPVENRWVGQHIRDPDPDIAGMASALGLRGVGPVESPDAIESELARAVQAVADGASVVVDVRVAAQGYPGSPSSARGPETSTAATAD